MASAVLRHGRLPCCDDPGAGCLAAVQSGPALWIAVRTAAATVRVVRGGSAGPHCTLRFPTPVSLVQLGAPLAVREPRLGNAVLLVVGEQGEAWAFHLTTDPLGGDGAAAAEVQAGAVARLVDWPQAQRSARCQLAALAAWEWLDCRWGDEALAVSSVHPCTGTLRPAWGKSLSSGPPAGCYSGCAKTQAASFNAATKAVLQARPGGVAPIPLDSLASFLAQGDSAPAPPTHSVCSWLRSGRLPVGASCAARVVLLPPPDPGVEAREPADAPPGAQLVTGACQVVVEAQLQQGAGQDPEGGSSYQDLLLLGTQGNRVLALPLGMTTAQQPGAELLPPGGLGAAGGVRAAAMVCVSPAGIVLLPAAAAAGIPGRQQQQQQRKPAQHGAGCRLALLTLSGQLERMPRPADDVVEIVRGSPEQGSALGDCKASSAAGDSGAGSAAFDDLMCRATLSASGPHSSLLAVGSSLVYVADGQLCVLECGSLQPQDPATWPQAVRLQLPWRAWLACRVAEAPVASGRWRRQQQLVLLSQEGEVVSMPWPSPAGMNGLAQAHPSAQELQACMQRLLGQLDEATAAQQERQADLLRLDRGILGLAAAVPAAAGMHSAAGLRCAVEPLWALQSVLGAGAGAQGGAVRGVVVRITIENRGSAALTPDWAVAAVVTCGPSGVCSRASCAAHGAFLAGGLEPGASWSRVVQFNVAWAGLASLQVLLCYHSGPSGVPCAALLHTMQLDELCFLVAGTAAAHQPWRAPWQQQPALAAGAAVAECKMLLQVPRVVLDPPPAPDSVLRALLQLGQASAEDEHETWPPADGAIDLHPSTAFAPPPAQPASSGHGLALAWTGTRPASMRSADFPAGGVELGLDALPAASQRGSAMAGFTAFSVATRGRDTATALHAHAALADRALMAQALSCRAWLQDLSSGQEPEADPAQAPAAPPRACRAAAAIDVASLEAALGTLRCALARTIELQREAHAVLGATPGVPLAAGLGIPLEEGRKQPLHALCGRLAELALELRRAMGSVPVFL